MLEFNEEKHEYTLDGKKLISVTQLMQKHGLAPSYAGVSTEVLTAKAERGSLIHKEIEDFNKSGAIGFTPEMANFKKYIEKNKVKVCESELRLNNDIVAGTCDLILNYGDGYYTIADIKTTSKLHDESVSWQLSIYAYLTKNPAIKKGQAFHFIGESGCLKVVDIPLKPIEEVEKLMECERNGVIYKYEANEVVVIDDNQITEIAELEELIKMLDGQVKAAKQKQDELKGALLQEMESRGLKSFEKGNLKITYVAPSTRATLDSKAIKEKYPAIYEAHLKETEIKASLKITLKGEK